MALLAIVGLVLITSDQDRGGASGVTAAWNRLCRQALAVKFGCSAIPRGGALAAVEGQIPEINLEVWKYGTETELLDAYAVEGNGGRTLPCHTTVGRRAGAVEYLRPDGESTARECDYRTKAGNVVRLLALPDSKLLYAIESDAASGFSAIDKDFCAALPPALRRPACETSRQRVST